MKVYKTNVKPVTGTQSGEIYKKAFDIYKQIKSRTKRRPYIRSAYFNKDKIFLELFWQHLRQKNWRDRARRTPLFPCALDLLRNSRIDPESKDHPKDRSQIIHRFTGKTPDKKLFRVQVKEDKKTGNKWFLSVYPVDVEE